jgi:DNA replication and repair protein RecF
MQLRDLRNIREAEFELGPGLNVFVGQNAQGKTTILEAIGLLSRARSFRTEKTEAMIRRGAEALWARGVAVNGEGHTSLEVQVRSGSRRLRVNDRDVTPASYHGRLEVVVYSTDRLRVVRGPMRERRQYVDRSASALWPTYRQAVRDFERVLLQRNALLEGTPSELDTWNERFIELGGQLRQRRAVYVERLRRALGEGFHPADEVYDLALDPAVSSGDEEAQRRNLSEELRERRREELRARRSLAGPHRDSVALLVNGEDAAANVSSGQARSLLLALTLATLEVYREERGDAAVALLDDLDSELDEERAASLCRTVASRGQALVTTAHRAWVDRLGEMGRRFQVSAGRVASA